MESKVALLLGNCEEEGRGRMCYVLDREMVAEKEGFVVWRANGRKLVPSFPLHYEQLDTAHALLS